MVNLRGYELKRSECWLLIIGIIIASLGVSYLMYRTIVFAVVGLLLLPWAKSIMADTLAERRRRRYMSEFKDFLFLSSTSIGAGRSMKDAIYESIPTLREIHGNDSILATELSKVYERIELGGELDVSVLGDMASASGLEDVHDFVTIYSICKTTGASLIIALNTAASVIIDKMTIEREIEELVRRKKNEGLVIFIMPIVVILFLNITAPDYISSLYETLAGRIIMTAVIVITIGIYSLIKKITRIEI